MARATKNVGKKSGKKEEKKGVQKKTSAKNVQKPTKARAGKKGQSQKTTPAKKPTSASNRKSKPQVAPSKPMRKFRQRATIGQEDLLSRLPSDCLNTILYMMNQYELNVLSTASQTLYAATVIARPKSIKRRFANITISQVDYYKTFVVISKPDSRRNNYHRTYAVRLDRATDRYETYFRKQDNILKIPVAHYIVSSTLKLSLIAPLHHKVRYHLLPRLVRLSFDSYTFDAIGIDEQFLQNFENIRSQPLKSLKFERCAFDKKFGDEEKSRFLSFILEAKPRSLTLDFPRKEERHIFDERFILRYAESVQFPGLILADNMRPMIVTRKMVPIFAMFHELNAVSLRIAPDNLLEMILNRLDVSPLSGKWRVTVTGEITDSMTDGIDKNKYTYEFSTLERADRAIGVRFNVINEDNSHIAKVVFFRPREEGTDCSFLYESGTF